MKRRYNHLKEKAVVTDFINDEDTYEKYDDGYGTYEIPNNLPEDISEEAYYIYLEKICGSAEYGSINDFYDRYQGYYESPKEFIEEYIDCDIDSQDFLEFYSGWFIDLDELGKEILYQYENEYDLGDRELYGASEFIGDYDDSKENISEEKNLSEEEVIQSRVLGEIEALISEGHRYDYERIAKAYLNVLVSVKNNLYGTSLLDYIEETFGGEYLIWDNARRNFFDGLIGDFAFCDGYVFRVY